MNGVPLKRVNQAYVIGTQTKVDISSCDVSKFEDKYFMKEHKKKVKKTEGEFFKSDEEVCLFYLFSYSYYNVIHQNLGCLIIISCPCNICPVSEMSLFSIC